MLQVSNAKLLEKDVDVYSYNLEENEIPNECEKIQQLQLSQKLQDENEVKDTNKVLQLLLLRISYLFILICVLQAIASASKSTWDAWSPMALKKRKHPALISKNLSNKETLKKNLKEATVAKMEVFQLQIENLKKENERKEKEHLLKMEILKYELDYKKLLIMEKKNQL